MLWHYLVDGEVVGLGVVRAEPSGEPGVLGRRRVVAFVLQQVLDIRLREISVQSKLDVLNFLGSTGFLARQGLNIHCCRGTVDRLGKVCLHLRFRRRCLCCGRSCAHHVVFQSDTVSGRLALYENLVPRPSARAVGLTRGWASV